MLNGKKVRLEVIEPHDLEWIRKQRNRPELRQYFRETRDIAQDKQQAWYEKLGNNNDPSTIMWKIVDPTRDTGRNEAKYGATSGIVGVCGLTYINWVIRRAELSVYVVPEEQGCGFAKDAIITMYDHAFDDLNLHNIIAECYDNNPALSFYEEAIGMKRDGIMRHSYFWQGEYRNSIMLSLLEEEWREHKKSLVETRYVWY